MRNRDLDYLGMVSVVNEVLEKYQAVWTASEPATRQVDTIHSTYADLGGAQQNAGTTSTGLTKQKNEAEEQMVKAALKLAGFAKSYALDKEDADLEAKVKLKKGKLNVLRDEELEQRMQLLHKDLLAIGQPFAGYGSTPEQLAAFAAAIQQFTKLKPAAQVVIKTRKGHNSTVPQLMATLQTAFTILDGLVPQWDDTHPDFIRDYENARDVKGPGGGGKEDKPDDDKKPDA